MLNEKKTLILIFTAVFLLGATLLYLMIKKDLLSEAKAQKARAEMSQDDATQTEIWPKVEIQTRGSN